ncbi:MAG TPA: hypothetical protein DIW64_18810 [Cellvibrio sp.]|nr:hypothetical protein [Cellvibrio sp.]
MNSKKSKNLFECKMESENEEQVCERLGIDNKTLRQYIGNHRVYAIKVMHDENRRKRKFLFPVFQFDGSQIIPRLSTALKYVSKDTHPAAINKFFLMPTDELKSRKVNGPISPRDWLIAGGAVVDVIRMIQELAESP